MKMKYYICRKGLHQFILDEKGMRYDLIKGKNGIKIIKRNDKKLLIPLYAKPIEMPKKVFFKRLNSAKKKFEGKSYNLIYRNCYSFVRYMF